jgi:hypothetical protein
MTAETPGTPATTEAVAYLDRDGDMWLPSGDPEVLLRLDPDCWVSRDSLTDVGRHYGPLVPLVREDVVAGREAAAREEGRAEGRNEVYARIAAPMAESDAAIARLRAEVASLTSRLSDALAEEDRLRARNERLRARSDAPEGGAS